MMLFNKKTIERMIAFFTIGMMTIFLVHHLIDNNYAILYDAAFIYLCITTIILLRKYVRVPFSLYFGLMSMTILHISGLFLTFRGTRLYDFWIYGHIFKYDNLVHTCAIFVITFAVYFFLVRYTYINDKLIKRKSILFLVLVMIALGVGCINEIIEFIAVVFLNGQSLVGDYLNNAKDLVFNLIGSSLAALLIIWKKPIVEKDVRQIINMEKINHFLRKHKR